MKTTTERMYRITIPGESKETVARLLNMAGLAQSHAKEIVNKNGVDLSLSDAQVSKLKDLGFVLYRVITK